MGDRERRRSFLARCMCAAAILLLHLQGCATWTDEYALTTLDEARKLAEQTGKPILVDFRTAW